MLDIRASNYVSYPQDATLELRNQGDWYERIKNLVTDYLLDQITLEELAAALGMTPEQIEEMIQEQGKPAGEGER